jgi:hypothetical protein
MEPFDDHELARLLREWKAPAAPPALRSGVRGGGPSGVPAPWWRWLFAGSIRVPVPVAVAVALLFAVWAYSELPATEPLPPVEPTVSLADFEPVRQLEPRVVGAWK